MSSSPETLRAIDSHTGGEPTRIITAGLPELASAGMAGRRDELRDHYDHLRTALVHEPRGHDAIVVAFLTPAVEPDSATGVVFANDAGYLGMCGHGAIGVASALVDRGMVEVHEPETLLRLDTPAGTVTCAVQVRGGRARAVRIRNVPAYATDLDRRVEVPGIGVLSVDIAYGGNWFAFVPAAELGLTVGMDALDRLMAAAKTVRAALEQQGIRGRHPDGKEEILDHVKIHQPADGAAPECRSGSRALTLCPGSAYDRSPCGTGTSAKLAVLGAKGLLSPGEWFASQSVVGSCFRARILESVSVGGHPAVMPEIEGSAWITALCEFVIDPEDPFAYGIRSGRPTGR